MVGLIRLFKTFFKKIFVRKSVISKNFKNRKLFSKSRVFVYVYYSTRSLLVPNQVAKRTQRGVWGCNDRKMRRIFATGKCNHRERQVVDKK